MLSLATVSAGYGSFRALFDVSLEVAAGEAVGVIGPNGAGKTTMMRVISGLVPLVSGAMTFDGRALNGLSAHRIVERGIAHVPENRRLFPRLTVEDNLRIGAFIAPARARIAERMAWVYDLFPRLKERREQLAGTLSGGEQQMCAIGRALMSGPKLLLMDEPSAGRAARGAAGVRPGAPHPRRRAHRADRRAERPAGARSGRPRLSARGRPHPARRFLGRAERQRSHPPLVHGAVRSRA